MTTRDWFKWTTRAAAMTAAVALFAFISNGGVRSNADGGNTIDLSAYHITFEEDFSNFSVSPWGPNTRWIAHTPWHGDFGDAQFADPTPGFPFTVKDGVLRIEARRGEDGKWRSGLLATNDPDGRGFSQQFGYFEIRAKLPQGPGVWPAFWLISNKDPDASIEIDVLEHYGVAPDKYQSVVHVWPKTPGTKPYEAMFQHSVKSGILYEDFHTYGVDVEPESTTFYFDRTEVTKTKTPPEHRRALFILVDLALGGGWPIDQAPNPSYMYVSYVRAYQK
jgi:beta-glucanase (GH16 family)